MDDRVEFSATDGAVLVVLTRPLSKYDDDLPEGFSISFDVSNYKIKDKYIYELTDENKLLYFIGPDIKAVVVPYSGNFPNYHLITKGFESFPCAKDFTMFTDKTLKVLFKIFNTFDNLTPKTQGQYNPHFWSKKEADDTWVVVIMPIRQ